MVIGFFALMYGYFFCRHAAVLRRASMSMKPMQGQQTLNINEDARSGR
ncbi:MAG: hypothetical protein QM736_08705 [Vicinamibacterales bacterium]